MARHVNFLLLLLMGTTWGFHFVLIKTLASQGVSADMLLFPTLLGITIVFVGLMFFSPEVWQISWKWCVFLVVCSVLGYAFPIWLEIVVARHIGASLITLMVTSTPVICIFLGWVFRLAKINRWHIACVTAGLASSLVLLLPESALPTGYSRYWLLAATGIPTSYALYNLYVANAWPDRLTVFVMAAYESVLAALITLPLFMAAVIHTGVHPLAVHWKMIILLCAVTAIEVWSFFEIVRRAGAIYVSFASFAALVSGVILSCFLLQESITPWMGTSIGVIMVSLLFCILGDRGTTSAESL